MNDMQAEYNSKDSLSPSSKHLLHFDSRLSSIINLHIMQHGKLNVGYLIAAYVPFIILTPFYCYYMAVKHQQEKPYPAATITATACHYPQDIYFRYYMLIASSLLALIFFLIFRWISNVAKDSGFSKRLPSYLYYLTQFSILLYGITIGTIDEKGTGPLHGPCAVAFFVILIIAIIQVTIYLTNMRAYDTRVIGRTSLFVKQLLAIYLVLLWIYCVFMLIAVSQEQLESKGDKYVVIVEWNTVTMGLLWVLSFYWQWDQLNLSLIGPTGDLSVDLNKVIHLQCSKTDAMIESYSRKMIKQTHQNQMVSEKYANQY